MPAIAVGECFCEACRVRLHPTELELRVRPQALSIQARMERVGTPERYQEFGRESWEARWGSWETTGLKTLHGEEITFAELVTEWLTGTPGENWLIAFIGAHGRRKTGLATAMLREALLAGDVCRWIDADGWVDSMIGEFDGGHWQNIYDASALASSLMIDDLAAVSASRTDSDRGGEWGRERISSLLRLRESHCTRTILTSNIENLEDLGRINPGLPSRLGNSRLVFKLTGKDWRQGY